MDKPEGVYQFFPMVTFNAGPLGDHNAIMLQFEWANLETRDKFQTPPLGFTRQQALDLINQVNKSLAKLDALQATGEGESRQ